MKAFERAFAVLLPQRPHVPGWYWWRPHGMDAWQALEVSEDRSNGAPPMLYVRQDSDDVYQQDHDPAFPWRGEWWPVRIESPPM
jgi:hypothetical protein